MLKRGREEGGSLRLLVLEVLAGLLAASGRVTVLVSVESGIVIGRVGDSGC